MPIFDNELNGNVSNRNYDIDLGPLGSAETTELKSLNMSMPSFDGQRGVAFGDLEKLGGAATSSGFDAPFSMVSRSELIANQRYPYYERGLDLENVYGLQQSGLAQIGNGLIKMGAIGLGTFAQSFATLPNSIDAAISTDMSKLSGGPDGYEAAIDDWRDNLENYFPNYVTRYEQSRGLATAIPFTYGSANFWGDKVIKNVGFTVGAIAGAVVQDFLVGAVTEGVGAMPLVGVQIGKASLWLNKLFSGANKVDRVLDLARGLGKSEQALLNIERLAQVAAAQKVTSGARYALSIYGSARTEAAVEARDGYNQVKKQLVSEYISENGIEPSGEDLARIEESATDAMNTRFGINMALLTVSNAVQFGNLFKTFNSAQKSITTSTIHELDGLGKIGLKEGTLDTFERKLPETFSGKLWEAVKPRTVNILTEGIYEEGGQFAAEKGVYDYYTRKYKADKNQEVWNWLSETTKSTVKGLDEQFGSKEGIENMVVGALTAGLIGEATGIIDKVRGNSEDDRINNTLNYMNQYGLTGILSNKYENTAESVAIAKQLQDAVKSGNIFEYKNLKADQFFNFVNAKLGVGAHELTIEQLKMLKDLSKEEFEKTFGMELSDSNKSTVASYVDSLITKANEIKEMDEAVNFTFKNPFKRVVNPKDEDEQDTNDKYNTFETWKKELTYQSYVQKDLDYRTASIGQRIGEISPLIQPSVLSSLTSETGLNSMIQQYESKIESLKSTLEASSPESRAQIYQTISKLEELTKGMKTMLEDEQIYHKTFTDVLNFEINNQDVSGTERVQMFNAEKLIEYGVDLEKISMRKKKASDAFDYLSSEEGFNAFFDERKKLKEDIMKMVQEEEEERIARENEPKETITIKTKKGERQIEIGTEYFLGRVVEYDKKGKEVYRAPRLTVLGQNEDGTIKVKDSDDKIHDLKPSVLEKYSLAKVSRTLSNRKAKFFMEHWNTVFEFNFGKGVKKKGRLRYEEVPGGDDRLYFVYTNKLGEVKEIEVTGNQFVPNKKKGFTEPMIKEVGELTATQKAAKKEFVQEEDPRIEAKLERRQELLISMYEEVFQKQTDTESLVEKKKAELEKIQKDLNKLKEEFTNRKNYDNRSKTIKFKEKFKQAALDALQDIKSLSRLEEDLKREIEELEAVAEDLQITSDYISDLLDNIETLPDSTKEFIEELEYEKEELSDLAKQNAKQLSLATSMLKSTEAAIDSSVKYLLDLVEQFEKQYPNVPSAIGQQWVDFLKANPNFLKLKPNYKEDLAKLEELIAQTEEFDIAPNEARIDNIKEHIAIMQEEFETYEKQLRANDFVLERLKDVYQKYKEQKQEERMMQYQEALQEEYIGSMDTSIQNKITNENYEPDPKKSAINVVGSTRNPDNNKPDNVRANSFGFRLNRFSESKKNKIKGVIVTQTTQELLQKGLKVAERIVENSTANANDVIALVMVMENPDGTISLIDEYGKPLTKEQLQNPTDYAIFQTFPSAKLEGKYSDGSKTMFRKGDEELIPSLTKQYSEWRTEQLERTQLDSPKSISASFGIPEYVKKLDDKGNVINNIDFDIYTPIEDTGILSEGAMESSNLLYIGKEDVVTVGSSTYSNAKGRVFLNYAGGLTKLNNRNFTEKEAELIWESIYNLSKIAMENKGTLKGDNSAKLIFNWLKSVSYWGIAKDDKGNPKEKGYNNIWFEKRFENNRSVMRLYISGRGAGFNMTPTSLEKYKFEIVSLIKGLYFNVNSDMISSEKWNQEYNELVGYSKTGELLYKTWPNYQTYLLSKEGRSKSEQIPITTYIRPSEGENDINRKGIYFILDEAVDKYEIAVKPAKEDPVAEMKVEPKVTPAPAKTETESAPRKYEGEFTLFNLPIKYKLDLDKYEATNTKEGLVLEYPKEVIEKIKEDKKVDEETALGILYAVATTKKIKELTEPVKKEETPVAEQPKEEGVPALLEGKMTFKYGEIEYKVDTKKFIETEGNEGMILKYDPSILEAMLNDGRKNPEAVIYGFAEKKIKAQIEAFNIKSDPALSATPAETPTVEPSPVAEPAPTAAVSDIESKKADIDQEIQNVSAAKNKEELIIAAEKLTGISPYDDGAVSMATRAALMTPGSFEKGKSLFLEEVKGIIEQKRKTELAALEETPVSDNTKTPIEGLNERLEGYGSAKVVLSKDFNEGERPKGRLNAFKEAVRLTSDNLVALEDINLNEFDFITEEDKRRLDALRPLAKELNKINTNDISSGDRRTVAVEKRYAQLTNQLANEFVDIVGKHVEQQLGKKITSSKPRINALEETQPTQQPVEEPTIGQTAQQGIDWQSATLENIKERLISGEIKEITSNFEEPGDTVKFSFYQEEDRQSQQMVGGVEDFAEVDIVEEPKGNYFSVENGFGESATFYENDPKLDKIINKVINYNKTVSAKQTTPTATPKEAPAASSNPFADRVAEGKSANPNRAVFRLITEQSTRQFTPENFEKLEQWLNKALPNVPVYMVKNTIKATNGRQAWGMFHKGAIYLYENAEIGTAYHEVFEAVWAMVLSPQDRINIAKDFRRREGSYVDRFTGETVVYKNATDDQMREELAEEFRDLVLYDKMPKEAPKPKDSFIMRKLKQLLEFIKSLFVGPKAAETVNELFSRIGNGYYAQYNPFEQKLSFAKVGFQKIDEVIPDETSVFRFENIGQSEVHEIIQHMTFRLLADMIGNNEDLFKITSPGNEKQVYENLKSDLEEVIFAQYDAVNSLVESRKITQEEADRRISNIGTLYNSVVFEWPNIVQRHKEFLATYGITFDENEDINFENYEKSKDETYLDARKIDGFRKINPAIKILLSTIVEVNPNNRTEPVLSPNVGGMKLLPVDQVYIDLLHRLSSSKDVTDMVNRLRQAAKENANYEALFRRIFKISPLDNVPVDYNKLKEHDLRVIASFWSVFKKQNPDVPAVFILPEGEIVIGNSNLSTQAEQERRQMASSIVKTIREDKSNYFAYNSKTGKYSASTALQNLKLEGPDLDQYVSFLNKFGIEIDMKLLSSKIKTKDEDRDKFRESVRYLLKDLKNVEDVVTLNSKTLNIHGRLLTLGIIKAKLENPQFETTYFNINGERSQTYIGPNLISNFHDSISTIENRSDISTTNFKYLLTDKFAKGSLMLKKMFTKNNERIQGTSELMKPVIIDGTINEVKNKKTESSKLNKKARFLQTLNLNVNGVFLNLVPGDSGMETGLKMHEEKSPFVTSEMLYSKSYLENIFKDYFLSEIEVSRDTTRQIKKVGDREATDLRFFKGILGEALHKKVVAKAKNKSLSAEEVYSDFKSEINAKIEEYFNNKADKTFKTLNRYKALSINEENMYVLEGFELYNKDEDYSKSELIENLKLHAINYAIANIELHKLIYSDPYFYSDELKRIKNFTSPKRALVYGSADLISAMSARYNEGLSKDDPRYVDLGRDYLRGATISDVFSDYEELGYTPYEETDGGGIMTDKGRKHYLIKSGEWTDIDEAQYKYDMAFMKQVLEGKNKLTPEEKDILRKGNPNQPLTNLKPVVGGSKAMGRDYNDVVLDKFALTPISFRQIYELNPDSNMLKFYLKMINEDVDYAVHKSGRKVGSEKVYELYTAKGELNPAPFTSKEELDNPLGPQTVLNLPFSIIGVQSDVPSKGNTTTQGTQPTKLATLDFMQAGVPIDFIRDEGGFDKAFDKWITLSEDEKLTRSPLYKEIRNNQTLLEARIEQGLETLLKKLGIVKTGNTYTLDNPNLTIELLREELLKREVNDNVIDALSAFENGEFVLEAIPSYQQIRNILYSIADKNVRSPKITGGQKVQVSSALLESVRAESKEVNGKQVYQSDILKFYKDKDGERVCEIMISRWFDSPLSDEELLKYFNETEEGQKVLRGIAYRIPTQKQNSIESIKIAKFLPSGFQDSVVVPSALVKKVGSDFDIDKLFIYLKNLYKDGNDNLKLVPFYGYGNQAREKFKDLYLETVKERIKSSEKKLLKTNELQSLFGDIAIGNTSNKVAEKWIPIFKEMFADRVVDEKLSVREIEEYFINKLAKIGKSLSKLTDFDLQQLEAEEKSEILYRQSLDNAYVESLENLISHELNFSQLVKPNSAKDLIDLTKEIEDEMGVDQIDYSNVDNMLDVEFMSDLRGDFVTGKYAIGIAAVNQTNQAQVQRAVITIDTEKIFDKNITSPEDKMWMEVGNGEINFENYNTVYTRGKERPTFSKILDNNPLEKKRNYISDVIGMMIDGYVDVNKDPWIIRLGITPNVASTWLLLIKLGVPINDIAFFMNQPIIRDYLKELQNSGYSFLFIKDYVEMMKLEYKMMMKSPDTLTPISKIPSQETLKGYLKYNNPKFKEKMSDDVISAQVFMLDEFLKYAKMAEQLFIVTQATNFDTATLNDPFLIFKKLEQIKKARKTIISSVDDILDNSFIGELKDAIESFREGIAQILLTDKSTNPSGGSSMRNVLEATLTPYLNENDGDFVRLSRKAVNTLFDWCLQTDNNLELNKYLRQILLGTEEKENVAKRVMDLKKQAMSNPNHPLHNNYILKSFEMDKGDKEGRPDNLYIKAKDVKAYDQNQVIYGFRELRKHLPDDQSDLYKKIVALSILQSGLTNSKISFTSLLPYEDFSSVYNQVLSKIDSLPNLKDFVDLNVFERTNWNDSSIVEGMYAKTLPTKKGGFFTPVIEGVNPKLNKAFLAGKIPMTVAIPIGSNEGRSDFVAVSWQPRKGVSKDEKKKMRKKGDRSYIKKGLFKKVYYTNAEGKRVPLIDVQESKGKFYYNYVYKMVNAWGDSIFAQEYYGKIIEENNSTISRHSIFENGFEKVIAGKRTLVVGGMDFETFLSGEVEDDAIVSIIPEAKMDAFEPVVAESTPSVQPAQAPISKKAIKEFNVGDEVQDEKYNVWKIISQEEYEKESRVKMKAGVKARFITNVNPNEIRRQDSLNPDSTTYIKPNSVNTIGENRMVQLFQTNENKSLTSQYNKPEELTQEEWDGLSEEEKRKINEC